MTQRIEPPNDLLVAVEQSSGTILGYNPRMLVLRIQDAFSNNNVRPCAPAINAPPGGLYHKCIVYSCSSATARCRERLAKTVCAYDTVGCSHPRLTHSLRSELLGHT